MGLNENWIVNIDVRAEIDIEKIIDYYLFVSNYKIAEKFYSEFGQCKENLKQYPKFQIRYNRIHCLPIPNFPYMIHFIVEEEINTVVILDIISTHMNPDENWIY